MAKFDACFCRVENQVVILEVEASSQEEAQKEAERMLNEGEVSFSRENGWRLQAPANGWER